MHRDAHGHHLAAQAQLYDVSKVMTMSRGVSRVHVAGPAFLSPAKAFDGECSGRDRRLPLYTSANQI
jgi:hypothetical protein